MSTQLPSYDELAAVLASQDDLTAAECHGILSGILSCRMAMDEDDWAQQALNGSLVGADYIALVDDKDKVTLVTLYQATDGQLKDTELGFQLMLPDDDASMAERVIALTEWCDGFLFGLSLGGVKEFTSFSEPVQEFSKDLIEISRLAHDENEGDENESAFFEVTEYVRMGALMLYDELDASKKTPPAGATLH